MKQQRCEQGQQPCRAQLHGHQEAILSALRRRVSLGLGFRVFGLGLKDSITS